MKSVHSSLRIAYCTRSTACLDVANAKAGAGTLRLTTHTERDGIGGTVPGNRWHKKLRAAFFGAEHPAVAVRELLVHLRLSGVRPPGCA